MCARMVTHNVGNAHHPERLWGDHVGMPEVLINMTQRTGSFVF